MLFSRRNPININTGYGHVFPVYAYIYPTDAVISVHPIRRFISIGSSNVSFLQPGPPIGDGRYWSRTLSHNQTDFAKECTQRDL